MEEEQVVLVDEHDNEVGTAPKLRAHIDGALHRAVSVFIFNDGGEMLLQRRAVGKYHSGGLWSNACCSHPRPGEEPRAAAARRLVEEMGIRVPLEEAFSFIYRAEIDTGLTEHELDHVFVGIANEIPSPDPHEVEAWRWASLDDVRRELNEQPDRFTAWFPLAVELLLRRTSPRERPPRR